MGIMITVVMFQLLLFIAVGLVLEFNLAWANVTQVERRWYKSHPHDKGGGNGGGDSGFDFSRAHQLVMERQVIDSVNSENHISAVDALRLLDNWRDGIEQYIHDYQHYLDDNDPDGTVANEPGHAAAAANTIH